MSATTDDARSPAARLRDELVAAGVPVRSVVHDRRGGTATLDVTYWPAVTAEHLALAGPIVAAARERIETGGA